MRDLSMHVLDIACNSVKAGAALVSVAFVIDEAKRLILTIRDDGCGMTPEFLNKAVDPFTTTRTTRRVGLGIPMLKQSAEACGGMLDLQSEVGKGTTLTATFDLKHIDCPPMGTMCDTLLALTIMNPDKPDFMFTAESPACTAAASFDTRPVREALGKVPLNEPDVIAWIKESIDQEFRPILEEYV